MAKSLRNVRVCECGFMCVFVYVLALLLACDHLLMTPNSPLIRNKAVTCTD